MLTSFCGAAVFKLKRTVGVVWKCLIIFHCFCGPTIYYLAVAVHGYFSYLSQAESSLICCSDDDRTAMVL